MDTTISISVESVRHATNSFSQGKLLGEGGFSRVFSGEMDGKKVTMKRIERMRFGRVVDEAIQSFKHEVQVLTKVRHTNLVALLGYCWDEASMILEGIYLTGKMKACNHLIGLEGSILP